MCLIKKNCKLERPQNTLTSVNWKLNCYVILLSMDKHFSLIFSTTVHKKKFYSYLLLNLQVKIVTKDK